MVVTERYLKQVIVMRRDLNMPHGKLATMAAHASMKWLVDKLGRNTYIRAEDGWVGVDAIFTAEQWQWLTEIDPGIEHTGQQSFAKIVVFVGSHEELQDITTEAARRGLTTGTVHDSGYSHNPAGTFVGVAIGPHWPEAFEGLTDHLKTR